jgi:hypothetical protein
MPDATAAPTWKPVDGDLFPFFSFKAVGDKLNGKLIAKRQGTDIEGKPQDLYDFMTADGGRTVGASNKDLKTKLAKIEIGKLVSMEYTGTKKIPGKGKPMKLYVVQTAG